MFSGYHRVYLQSGLDERLYEVNLRNGRVRAIEKTANRQSTLSAGWVSSGVAERIKETVTSVVYGSFAGSVERQLSVLDNKVTVLFALPDVSVCSLTVDATLSRWYYYYAGDAAFGSGSKVSHECTALTLQLAVFDEDLYVIDLCGVGDDDTPALRRSP